MYKYSYLIADSIFVIAWLLIYFYRKDTRKEQLWVSLVFGLTAYLLEALYIIDWWHPETITGTALGVEDFMFCFFGGGATSVLFQQLFRQKTVRAVNPQRKLGLISIFLFFSIFYFTFYILNLHSFYASLLGFTCSLIIIWKKRIDLILPSIVSGLIVGLLGIGWFWWVELTSPGWVEAVWYLDKLSGIIVLKSPIEDLVWAVFSIAYISIIYKFWNGLKLISK
jgi:hypothetical protein